MSDIQAVERNESLAVHNGHLYLENCKVVDLASEFGTPIFAISERQLRQNYRRFSQAFIDRWPEGEVNVLPAFKAAPYLAIRTILSQEGAGCDTFGASELEGALRGNTRPDLISVNGSIKSADTIRTGIEIGARIVIDSPRELTICLNEAKALGRTARVMFRIKPNMQDLDLESDFGPMPIKDLSLRLRYGIPTSEIMPLGDQAAASDHIDVIGFHCHVGRHSTDMKLWAAWVQATVDLIADLRSHWGWKEWAPRHLDFGGGYAPPGNYDTDHHRTGEPAPPIEVYADTMTSALRSSFAQHGISAAGLVIEFEPGRALHSDTGIHITTIDNIKASTGDLECKWAEIDTTEQFLGTYAMDPSQPPFKFVIANKMAESDSETMDIVGKSCGGEMILLDVQTPQLVAGDLVTLLDTGAYIESLACNFNALPRPGTILVSGDQAQWIREPETIEQVYSRDRIPDYLA